MGDYIQGLRQMFGMNPVSARARQLDSQEQQFIGTQPQQSLRQAPVQATQIPLTGVPSIDAAEMERQERQRALEAELLRLRGGN